ncbi:MAG: FAD-dependent monooxygenase [Xanthobacteraceae bacterium]
MPGSRTIIVAGAGIGGLTAALALARNGFSVVVVEQAERLEEAGAGIQLSPNATRVLLELGLGERLRPRVVSPAAVLVRAAWSSQEIVRIPMGETALKRYGAPYWVVHRADLQAALAEATGASPNITMMLGAAVEDFGAYSNGVTVNVRGKGQQFREQRGIALVGADGLWSRVRVQTGHRRPPRFRRRTAWRATLPADAVGPEFREPLVHLWLGADGHLVHYPVKAGALINIVGVVSDDWQKPGWSEAGSREEVLSRFSRWSWATPARDLLALPERWLKWALYDLPPSPLRGTGPVTLLGDAAHPMLPFLSQGAAMAIEDAAVLAEALKACPQDPTAAMRAYEDLRGARTARMQRSARRMGRVYGLAGPAAAVRNAVMQGLGGARLLAGQDWIYTYDWKNDKPPTPV